MNLEAKWPKNLFLKTDGEVNRQICTPKVSILRSAIYEATLFFKSLYQNYGFLGKGRPSKIKLLQSYQVLWIYWCEPNCIYKGLMSTAQMSGVLFIIIIIVYFEPLLSTNTMESFGVHYLESNDWKKQSSANTICKLWIFFENFGLLFLRKSNDKVCTQI